MENDVLYNRIMNVIHEEYGEGSTAVANPEGEATGDLEKIQIGDEIYGISGGGGSNEPFFITITYETTESEYTITLDCSFNDVKDALLAGKIMYVFTPDETYGDSYSFAWVINLSDAPEEYDFSLQLYVSNADAYAFTGEDRTALLSATIPL